MLVSNSNHYHHNFFCQGYLQCKQLHCSYHVLSHVILTLAESIQANADGSQQPLQPCISYGKKASASWQLRPGGRGTLQNGQYGPADGFGDGFRVERCKYADQGGAQDGHGGRDRRGCLANRQKAVCQLCELTLVGSHGEGPVSSSRCRQNRMVGLCLPSMWKSSRRGW